MVVSKRRVMAGALAAAALLTFAAATASADAAGEIRAGYYTDAEEGFLGGGLLVPMSHTWDFNPNLEWVFLDNVDYFTVNADIHKDLNHYGEGPAVWLGGGAAIIVFDRERIEGEDTTDMGVNLLGGVGAKRGEVRPFGQMKVTLSDDTETSFAFGLRF